MPPLILFGTFIGKLLPFPLLSKCLWAMAMNDPKHVFKMENIKELFNLFLRRGKSLSLSKESIMEVL
jgi:hypothetical protein